MAEKTAFDESVCPLLDRVRRDDCSGVKSHHRCDGQSAACLLLLLPSVLAASLRSQGPPPSWWPLSGPTPTRRRSRSDSDPPRCSRSRPLHTACRGQTRVSAGSSSASLRQRALTGRTRRWAGASAWPGWSSHSEG